jgi:hypothetical protein
MARELCRAMKKVLPVIEELTNSIIEAHSHLDKDGQPIPGTLDDFVVKDVQKYRTITAQGRRALQRAAAHL